MDDQLRLGAVFKDDASPAVRKLRAELAALNEATKDGRQIAKLNAELTKLRRETAAVNATPGMKAAEQWFRTSSQAAAQFAQAGSGVSGILGTIGLGALSAAGSLAGLAAGVKETADRVLSMKENARQFGVSLDYLAKFEGAGKSFGLTADTMDRALSNMAAQLPALRAGVGPLLGFLQSQGWADLAHKLGTEDTAHALDDILHQLDKIKNPAVRGQVLGKILGAPELEAIYGRNGYQGFVDSFKAQKGLEIGPDFLKQAQALRDAQNEFNTSLTRFEVSVGPTFLGVMTEAVHQFDAQLDMFKRDFEWLKDFFGSSKDWQSKHPASERFRPGMPQQAGRAMNPAPAPSQPVQHHVGRAMNKVSFSGNGGLLHLASYQPGGGSSTPSDMIDALAEGTRQGFLAAFRDLMATNGAASGAAPGPGITMASFGGSSPGGLGAGRGPGYAGGGGGLGAATAVDKTLPKEARALLDAIAAGEAKDYNVMNGGGTFSDYSRHPGGRAAGRYQDLPSTWRRISGALGLHDFSPESQDKGNWWLAQQDYRSRTHRDLLSDLRSGNPNVIANIGRALHSTWVSTNGSFAGRYAGALGRGEAGGIGLNLRTLNEECVSLAKAAVGAAGSVHDWRRGVNALDGSMKPGTPIATFLDSMGHLSNRYAGGGTGTPGVGRDHAAIFRSYIRDKNGNIIGMSVAEQSRGHPPHLHDYMKGGGYGERDASNYFGIKGADGSYLGGDRNPMNRRATGLSNPTASASAAARTNSHVHLEIEHPQGSAVKIKNSSGPISTAFRRRWPRHDFSSAQEA